VTPESPETYISNVQAYSLKPAAPNNFDGDHLKGHTFLNSCRLYISLCRNQFWDKQTQIKWALSILKSGCASIYANCILQREALEDLPFFLSWWDFEQDFSSNFCPRNEAMTALTKLESRDYHQGKKAVDDYIDKFSELVDEAGYMDASPL
jgi:hypothetical protein